MCNSAFSNFDNDCNKKLNILLFIFVKLFCSTTYYEFLLTRKKVYIDSIFFSESIKLVHSKIVLNCKY